MAAKYSTARRLREPAVYTVNPNDSAGIADRSQRVHGSSIIHCSNAARGN